MRTKKNWFNLPLVIAYAIFLSACGTTHTFNHMTYLADSVTEEQKAVLGYKPLVFETGDRISIKVNAFDPESAQLFNGGTPAGVSSPSGSISGGTGNNQGYLIDENGEIRFPQLGLVKAAGLTASALADTIENKLTNFIKEPLVTVELVNFKVNVLGEVNRPGTIIVPDGKITILEAISQSGDLSINGLRDNILIVRQTGDKREYGRVNLSSNSIFQSRFFYLKQGDIVYVQMNKNKLLGNDQEHTRNVSYISIALTLLTAAAIVYNILR